MTKPEIFQLAFMSDFHADDEDDIDRALFLVDDAVEQGADHLVIGGDIVERAQPRLLERFARGLRRRGLAGRTTVVPGNHDVYAASKSDISNIFGSGRDLILGKTPFGQDAQERFEAFGRLFGGGRSGHRGERLFSNTAYPFSRVLTENVVLVALDSTRNDTKSPLGCAAGELQEEDIDAARAFFEAHPRARHRLVVMHHAPWIEYSEGEEIPSKWRRLPGVPDAIPMGMADPDHETAVEWLKRAGATLVLCGHWHAHDDVAKKISLGRSLLGFCAGTAGGLGNDDGDAAYHILGLRPDGRWNTTERAFSEEELELATRGRNKPVRPGADAAAPCSPSGSPDPLLKVLEEAVAVLCRTETLQSHFQQEIEWLKDRRAIWAGRCWRVGLIGITSSGKSTLVNALLDDQLLPVRVRPSSNCLVVCRKGPEAGTAYFEDGSVETFKGKQLAKELNRLADETTNPSNKLGVKEIELNWPYLFSRLP
jgi:hypothetical protein